MNERHIESFSRIFQSTKDRMYHFVWKMTRNEADTEDIIQNCYLRLWQQMETVDTSNDALPLLFTYARNLVTDHWRKTAGRQQPLADAPESIATPVEDHIDYKDSLRQLDAGIAQLPAKRRQIFKLVKEEGLSHQHVADHLGISPATVEKQVVLSLRFLRKELGR
jgi:RNA polymerase sigma factor (sigma-70 family)